MASTLKLCLMVHIEDNENWPALPDDANQLPVRLGYLAQAVGTLGAKVSLQVGSSFFDPNLGYTGPSSLRLILENGGNFWPHCHATGFTFLHDLLTKTWNAYKAEEPATGAPMGDTLGRSGGWAAGDSSDWVQISANAGLRFHNSTVMLSHAVVPQTMRPYQLSDQELEEFYPHDTAPGPLYADILTMRMRPFYADAAASWFDQVAAGTDVVDPGDLLILPVVGRFSLFGVADRRDASSVTTLTPADLEAALTEVWSVQQLKASSAMLNSISQLWYKQLSPEHVTAESVVTIAAWVSSVNEVMGIGGATPVGQWANMNEIGSMFEYDPYL